jgi:hypothetical protein
MAVRTPAKPIHDRAGRFACRTVRWLALLNEYEYEYEYEYEHEHEHEHEHEYE